MKLPTVSVVIPTFNEEKNIIKCLNSIFMQNYPHKNIEVIVVDNYSTDKTIELAKKHKVKLFFNKIRHGEVSKMIGFKKATSELVFYMDADIELRGKGWLRKMTKPLMDQKDVIGSFTRYYSKKESPAIERYLNMDPLQRDGIYQYFSPQIEEVIISKNRNYSICEYNLGKIPPAGLCVYRRVPLLEIVKKYKMFLELDFLVLLTKNKLKKFAYVPSAGLYHSHVTSFINLLKKRKYNLEKVYLGRKKRLYQWFDLKSFKGKLKVIFWVVYANSMFPSFFTGIIKSIKYKDLSGLYEPLVNFVLTDYLIILFIFNKSTLSLIKNV